MANIFRRGFWSSRRDRDHRCVERQAFLIAPEDLKIVDLIGDGQYGVVRHGEWTISRGEAKTELKEVAVKSLKNTADEKWLSNILREALTMQKLSHTNIVKFYGISYPPESDNTSPLMLVTEFAPLGSLEQNLKNKGVSLVSTLCKFASQVAHGMHYLASQNLIHRDLSTRNILLFKQDLVKISDFGLARSLENNEARMVSLCTPLAFAWMPPEVLQDYMFTLASDVWSYGITLWEMFSFGQKPWATLPFETVREITNFEENKRLKRPDACPDGYYELIMLKSWESNPENRPTFKDIIENIIPVLQPKEVTTKLSHEAKDNDQLSFSKGEKVTVISSVGNGMLLVQSIEKCSIGLIDEKHVHIAKKSSSRLASRSISGPFNLKTESCKSFATDTMPEEAEEGHSREFADRMPSRHRATLTGLTVGGNENPYSADPVGCSEPYEALKCIGSNETPKEENIYKVPRSSTSIFCPDPGPKDELAADQKDTTTTPAGNHPDGKPTESAKRKPVPTPRRSKEWQTFRKDAVLVREIVSTTGLVRKDSDDKRTLIDERSEKDVKLKTISESQPSQVEEPGRMPPPDLEIPVNAEATSANSRRQGSDFLFGSFQPVQGEETFTASQSAGHVELNQQPEEIPEYEEIFDFVPPIPPKTHKQEDDLSVYKIPRSIPMQRHVGPNVNEAKVDEYVIKKIQEECGEDVDRGVCYSAFHQCQGNLEEAILMVKAQKLSTITGETIDFCKRTLKHCSHNIERAANYIFG
ncbi:ack-related non-receptor tyrosine kinase-like [Montipora capricornis]|uniref:ack-related non-receptor tyrosine kinase-like n=1 Tax=Montipora capricornis TaxID=246305 RepID=UPI0035F17B01